LALKCQVSQFVFPAWQILQSMAAAQLFVKVPVKGSPEGQTPPVFRPVREPLMHELSSWQPPPPPLLVLLLTGPQKLLGRQALGPFCSGAQQPLAHCALPEHVGSQIPFPARLTQI
jgi:hypothetical protein